MQQYQFSVSRQSPTGFHNGLQKSILPEKMWTEVDVAYLFHITYKKSICKSAIHERITKRNHSSTFLNTSHGFVGRSDRNGRREGVEMICRGWIQTLAHCGVDAAAMCPHVYALWWQRKWMGARHTNWITTCKSM